MRSVFWLVASWVLAVCTFAACGEELTKVPDGIPNAIESRAVVGVLPGTYRTILGLSLGRHTLADAAARLGKAPIVKRGRFEGGSNTVCYRAIDSRDDIVVVFEAGPLGGYETLTAVTITSNATFSGHEKDCVLSVRVSRPAATAGLLRLGSDIDRVATALRAKATKTRPGMVEIAFQQDEKIKRRDGKVVDADTSSGIVAGVDGQSVVWFQIYYTQSS